MKRKEENRSVIEPSCTFFKPNKINCLPSNRVLDRKPDRVIGYKVLIDLTSLLRTNLWNFYTNNRLFIPLQYTTWLKISKDTLPPPHLVHVSGKGYFYMSSHGTRYSGIT